MQEVFFKIVHFGHGDGGFLAVSQVDGPVSASALVALHVAEVHDVAVVAPAKKAGGQLRSTVPLFPAFSSIAAIMQN